MLEDTLISRDVLVTGEHLNRIATVHGKKRTVAIDGRRLPAVRTNAVVEFSPPRDLSPFNALLINLKLAEPFDGSLITRLEYSTRSPGMPSNDSRFSVLHFNQPRVWRGWQQVMIPAENLVAVGFPEGWKNVDSIILDVHTREGSGTVILGDIEMLDLAKPRGPRMSDVELLDALDLDRHDMRGVARHAKAGRVEKAIEAFAGVLRRTKRPPRGQGIRLRHYAVPTADAVYEHRILSQQLPRRIDWQYNPIGYLEWPHALNRHSWMASLANGFFQAPATKQRKYARKLDYFIRSWCEQNPEPIGHNGGLDPGWETLSTSSRLNWAWHHVLAVAEKSREFSDRTLITMAKMIHAHAEHLMNHWGHCNWFISESTAILTAAVLVPQFRKADRWARTAIRRLSGEMRTQVFDDGVQYELSPGYHGMSARLFYYAYMRGTFGGYAFSEAYRKKLMAMYDFLTNIRRPDGTFPVANDAGSCLRSGDDRLARVGRVAGRPDWIWAGTGGAEGTPPTIGSVHFPDAGYAVMRSGWTKDDHWAFMDMAEYGAGHQHEDKLQVEVFAHGTPFLIDPGISSYQHDPVVQYFRRSAGHNTIQIDGLGQIRKASREFSRYCSSSRGKNLWAAGRGLDFAQGRFDELYGNDEGHSYIAASRASHPQMLAGFAHTRALVFVRSDYWLILDTVTGRGEHTLEALWHFAPMHVRISRKTHTIRTNRLTKSNLELIHRADWAGGKLSIVTGQEKPTVQGFAAIDGEIKPIPCGIAAKKQRLPFHGVTVAAPYATGTDSGFGVTTEPVKGARGRGTLITVARPGGVTDRFLWRHTGAGVLAADGLRANARLAAVRANADGAVTYAAVMDGQSLRGRGIALKGQPGKLVES